MAWGSEFWQNSSMASDVKKINVGHAIKRTILEEVGNFGRAITKPLQTTLGQAQGIVGEARQAADDVGSVRRMMPWLLAGVGVVALVLFVRKR